MNNVRQKQQRACTSTDIVWGPRELPRIDHYENTLGKRGVYFMYSSVSLYHNSFSPPSGHDPAPIPHILQDDIYCEHDILMTREFHASKLTTLEVPSYTKGRCFQQIDRCRCAPVARVRGLHDRLPGESFGGPGAGSNSLCAPWHAVIKIITTIITQTGTVHSL